MCAVLRADVAGDREQAVDGGLDAAHRPHEQRQQRATISAATRPMTSATPRSRGSTARAGGGHRPTATLRSARAACSTRTPESLMRSIPSRPVGLLAEHSTALDGGRGLPGDPLGEDDDRDDDRGRDQDDQDAEHETHVPAGGCTDHCATLTRPPGVSSRSALSRRRSSRRRRRPRDRRAGAGVGIRSAPCITPLGGGSVSPRRSSSSRCRPGRRPAEASTTPARTTPSSSSGPARRTPSARTRRTTPTTTRPSPTAPRRRARTSTTSASTCSASRRR